MRLRSVLRGIFSTSVVVFGGFCLAVQPAHAQGVGVIQGRVTSSETQEPLASAQVFIPNTHFGTLTDAQGRFSMPSVPAGRHPVRIELIGYASAEQIVTVTAGGTATANFSVRPTVLKVDEVVATGVVGAMPQTKVPFTITKLSADQLPVPAPSAEGLLTGKVAGASVVMGDATPGNSADIVLRGVKSINAEGRSQQPLIIVDGVVSNGGMSDIASLDVDNIEIVKGASASSLYGARAANGVIMITTKRGTSLANNTAHYTFRSEYGNSGIGHKMALSQNHPYKMNAAGTKFIGDDGLEHAWSDSTLQPVLDSKGKAGDVYFSFQDKPWPCAIEGCYDQLDRFFRGKGYLTNNISVEGKRGTTNYYVSFNQLNEQGIVYSADGFQRQNFRLNLDHGLTEALQLSASSFYGRSKKDNANGDFFALTFTPPITNLLQRIGDSTDPLMTIPYADRHNTEENNPIYSALNLDDHTDNERFMGNVSVKYAPISWFNLQGNISYDRGTALRTQYYPKGYLTNGASAVNKGNLFKDTDDQYEFGSGLTASLTRQFRDLNFRARGIYAYSRQSEDYYNASGNNLAVKGVPALGTVQGTKNVYSFKSDVRSEGYSGIAGVDYKDRYVLDGLVRRDGSSLFGPDARWATYYRGSAAWRVSKEAFWSPVVRALPEFKLRASYGTAGNRPRFEAQYETYAVSAGSTSPQALGNRALKPEFARELEVGADALIFNRVSATASYVKTTVDDQILPVPLPGYAGFSYQWRNAGSLAGHTWEGTLEAEMYRTRNFTWSSRLVFDATKTKITKLDLPAYKVGQNDATYYIREGEEIGTFYGHKFAHACGDLNPALDCSQFQVNDDGFLVYVGAGNTYKDGIAKSLWGTTATAGGQTFNWGIPFYQYDPTGANFVRLGNTTPKYNFGLGNTVTFKGLSLYALFDGSQGFRLYNETRDWAMREYRAASQDQSGKPDELKKPVGYGQALYDVNATNDYFVEDGSYVKLRELSLRYTLSNTQLRGVGLGTFNRITLNLSGRNVHTWTKYQGYDPEVGGSGGYLGAASVARADDYQYPQFRTLTAAIEVVF